MSETQSTTAVDAKGRKLEMRRLDALEQFDIMEAAGANSTNAPWLGTAIIAACVRSIDDVPVPFPTSRVHIRALVGRLGTEGAAAVQTNLFPNGNEDIDALAVATGEAEAAKN